MRRNIPIIQESIELLAGRLADEPDAFWKRRIHMLYLLRLHPDMDMLRVAPILGMHRVTIGRWLSVYEQVGIEGLLAHPHPGRILSLPTHILDQLRQQLEVPGYFRSYGDVRRWLYRKFQLDVQYKTVHKIVYYVLKVKLPRR